MLERMLRFENPLYVTTVRRVTALFGAVGVGCIGVISVLFLYRRPSGTAALQGGLFLAVGIFVLAMIPVFVGSARKTLPVLIALGDDRILGWVNGMREESPQLVILFGDIRMLIDYRNIHFPLFPVPAVVSRRAKPGPWPIPKLVIEGMLSPESFTLTAANLDRLVDSLRVWIASHPGSEVEGGTFTPPSLRGRLGLPDSPGFLRG